MLMIEALAAFESLMRTSHNGAVATDPKTYYLAKGLYRLTLDLKDELQRLGERSQDGVFELKQKFRDADDKDSERERSLRQEIAGLRRELKGIQQSLATIYAWQIDHQPGIDFVIKHVADES